ncbi:MAG TPA: hypothetical protein VMS18_17030 [Candidatus Binatia bacterium]|nr:hypothetical protein [Candidatus Binatia bacterium]
MDGKDSLVHKIGAMLMEDPHLSARPWRHLVIVAQILPNSTKVNGFAYEEAGKPMPTGPRNLEILKVFRDLREAMREPGKEPWQACLVRIDSLSRDISIDFEYDHPEKWLISPATVKQMGEMLRPE